MGLPARLTIVLAAGAALGAQASAQGAARRGAVVDFRATDAGESAPRGWPMGPGASPLGGARPMGSAPLDLSGSFGAIGRGGAGADGALATLDTGFESLAPLPANLVNQLDTALWGGVAAGVTGRPHFSSVSPLAPPAYGVVSDAVGGNTTKKLRALVESPGHGPSEFFARWARYNLIRTNTASPTQAGATPFIFRPTPGQDVRVAHDTYLTSIDSQWTSEPTHVRSGFIVARLLWGGQSATTEIGLPVGPIQHMYTLSDQGFLGTLFVACTTPATYRSGQPYPGGAGQLVAPPIGGWFKLIHEFPADGSVRHVLDLNDGMGEFVIYDGFAFQVGRVDRMAWSGAFETPGDAMYVDNLRIEGAETPVLIPPPLVCEGGYLDDIEWLLPEAVNTQIQNRWLGAGIVVERPAASGNQVIELTPGFSGPVSAFTALPLSIASQFSPARACARVESGDLIGNGFDLTLRSIAEDSTLAARLLCRFDGVYVQINRNWNPQQSQPVIGVDIVDTGVDWTAGAHDVCLQIDPSGALHVSLDGVSIFTGEAFVRSFDWFELRALETRIWLDDVAVDCAALPPVTLPPLALPYLDGLEWGYEGVSLRLHDDDANPQTFFRWGAAANTPIIRGAPGNPSASFALENFAQSEPPSPGAAPRFATGAGTDTPQIEATPTRGWAVRADNLLTDFFSTRGWTPEGSFGPTTQLAISGSGGEFWVRTPTPGMPGFHEWTHLGVTPQSLGVSPGQWFPVTVRLNLNGKASFRVNGRTVRWAIGPNIGQPVLVDPLDYTPIGPARAIEWFGVQAGDERFPPSAPPGARSIHHVDTIRVWALPCLGDTNDDGVVNFTDLNNVLGFFGQSPPSGVPGSDLTGNIAPDANNDGVPDDDIVNFADLNAVLSGFGVPCS